MTLLPLTLVISSLAASAYAQTFRTRHRTTGGLIVGIIFAVVAGLIFLLVIGLAIRRRRRGVAMLPGPGGFMRINRPGQYNTQGGMPPPQAGQPTVNTNQSSYQPSYQAPEGPPPPPYMGKETYPGQSNGAPQPGGFASPSGGFAPPPGEPPLAHIEGSNKARFGWFNKNNQ